MALLPWMLLALLPLDTPPRDAEQFMSEGQYFMAESIWLGEEPADLITVAGNLTRVALHIGNLPEKNQFYKTYLTKSPQWRGVSLFVLAALAAHDQRHEDLRAYGRLFLQEFPTDPHPLKYRLLYHLARYTPQPADSLNLTAEESTFFEACRRLPASQQFPDHIPPQATDLLQFGRFFDQDQPFELPAEPTPQPFLAQLLEIQNALNQDDDNTAATALNQLARQALSQFPAEWRALFYRQLSRFYTMRGDQTNAEAMTAVATRLLDQAVLPFVVHPDALIQPVAEPMDTPETTTAPEPQPSEEGDTFPLLEELVRARQPNLDTRIKALTPQNTYEKIYRNYLLGLLYLDAGRLTSAFERLDLAQSLIRDYPFPILETKILTAIGRYYQLEKNPGKADWYRIQAIQVWNAPEHLPVFVKSSHAKPESPYAVLLDRALMNGKNPDTIHQLIYYNESQHFQDLRRRAYTRNVLSRNLVIGGQLGQIGDQIAQLVTGLAQKSRDTAPPKRYNQALTLWNQLWEKTNPFYLDTTVPSVKRIQDMLNARDRVLSFIEGEEHIGVLVISKEQAFPLSLGLKQQYLDLTPEARFQFLESRLGPVWRHDGSLILTCSKSFNRDGFIQMIKARVPQPERLILPFSLKNFAAQKQAPACGTYAIFNQLKTRNSNTILDQIPRSDWFEDTARDQVAAAIESHDHLIYCGPVQINQKGLTLGAEAEGGFQLHETVFYNPKLCSMVLILDQVADWAPILDELELVNPHAALGITLSKDPNTLSKLNFEHRQPFVRIY